MNVLLSICVLSYNRVELLKELIDSIIASKILSNIDVELVVLDNGSNDETKLYLDTFADKQNIRIFRREYNLRGSAAYLELFEKTKGEWIIAPGDDDVFFGEVLQNSYSILKSANKDIVLMPFAARTIDDSGEYSPIKYQPSGEQNRNKLLGELMIKSVYWFPATFFRRKLVMNQDIPRTVTVFDWWIWIQGVLTGDVLSNNTELVKYRIHSGQEQLSFSSTFWSLDKTETFLHVIDSSTFREWIRKIDEKGASQFLNEIESLEVLGEGIGDQLIFLRLCSVVWQERPEFKEQVIEFLIRTGLDARYIAQYFGVELQKKHLKLALKQLGVSAEEYETAEDPIYIEKILNRVMFDFRGKEIAQSITPFEQRILRLYRTIRFSKSVRKLLKK